jgi:hypothetical protein
MSEQNNDMLAAMLAQYDTVSKNAGKQSTHSLDNYFTTYLPDGIDKAVRRVRILPTNGTPFTTVHVHKATVDGKNRKFTCLAKLNDEPCPFCEARAQLLATGLESDKELAKNYTPKLMYMVKVIDRENEDHGPKFWRFPAQTYKKDGVHDKIMDNVALLKENIGDAETGRDLFVTINRVTTKRGSYPNVSSINATDKSKLSDNAEQAKAWIDDAKIWSDVYATKTYDYLEIIVKGGVPAWSKILNKFVDKASLDAAGTGNVSDELDAEIEINSQVNKPEAPEAPAAQVENTYVAEADVVTEPASDDLPF